MSLPSYSVPGVYQRPRPRARALPRVRTDIAGFVGVAGPRRLNDLVRVDDYRSYEELFLRNERGEPLMRNDGGEPLRGPPGSRLADCVRAFFLNGGTRCWVVNVASSIEGLAGADRLLAQMFGLAETSPPGLRRGLELLLTQDEVSLVALPELDATMETLLSRHEALPPSFEDSRFFECARRARPPRSADSPPDRNVERRLYSDEQVLGAQRKLIARLQQQRWRWFAILAPPPGLTPDRIASYRRRLTDKLGDADMAALYWPWLKVQGADGVEVVSPVGYVTGGFSARDVVMGPQWAPAGEPIAGVVGLEQAVDDKINGSLYDDGVNVLRAFPGQGVLVWGARTLLWSSPEKSRDDALAYVSGRRCLSAIERTVERLGQSAVFEPNRPLLRLQVAQAITGYLIEVFNSGALKGNSAEEAFFVQCDADTNPPEAVQRGELVCEVRVALVAPAEFVVFRLSTVEGSREIAEVA